MRIGIIGLGFVGSAVKNAYDNANIKTVCLDPQKGYTCTQNNLLECNTIFICVPSPQDEEGKCDTSILESVLENLKNYNKPIISKVTAPPGTYEALSLKYKNLIHAPEFLVAVTAKEDYLNGKFAIIGGEHPYTDIAASIIKLGQPLIQDTKICSIKEASLAKYTINSFLATKVIFMNEIYNLAKKINVDYDSLINSVKLDSRLGSTHFQVPGPDGFFGFGGACFPKDTSALTNYANSEDVDLRLLSEAIKINKNIRK
jgi:nucleotide sugar dehydrogenase